MAPTLVRLSKDWKRWEDVIDPTRFTKTFKKKAREALEDNSKYLAEKIKTRIMKGRYRINEPLTLLLKKSNIPLIDTGMLVKSTSYQLKGSYVSYVGVRRRGKDGVNVARILHNGATIPVSAAMRKVLARKINIALRQRGQKQTEESKKVKKANAIRIHPRPFINRVVRMKVVQKRISNRFIRAFEESLKK